MQFERLPISGHRCELVPNEFVRQDRDTDHLAVLLPGFGYSCDMPLFYYAESLLIDFGADIFRVEYAYNRREGFLDLPLDEQRAWLFYDVTASHRTVLGQRPYGELTVIGKSLGTLAMGHVLASQPPATRTRAVWLTPTLTENTLFAQMKEFDDPSLVVIGMADSHFNPVLMEALRTAGHDTLIIDGADHSLDIPGDVSASVRAVGQVVQALRGFIST